jgi:hypothetical protein
MTLRARVLFIKQTALLESSFSVRSDPSDHRERCVIGKRERLSQAVST